MGAPSGVLLRYPAGGGCVDFRIPGKQLGAAAAAHGAAAFMAHAAQPMARPALAPLAEADQNHRRQEGRESNPKSEEKSSHTKMISIFRLSAKVIEMDIFLFHAETVQQIKDCLVHHRRAAYVKIDVLRCRVIFEILIIQHIVDKTGMAFPVVLRQRVRESQVKGEIVMILLYFFKIFDVEQFLQAPAAIPE